MAIRRRARRLWAFWRSERRTFRQGFVALVLSTLASFVAGLVLGSITHTLQALPGLIILIPAAVGMRGTIFGAMGARLGTSSAVGLFSVSRDKDGVLFQNTWVAILLTLSSSLYLAVLARLAAAVFGITSISLWDFVIISVVGGLLGSILIVTVTVLLAVVSFRRGYDLDSVSTPMVTALADMFTLPMLFVATFLVGLGWVSAVVGTICIVLGLVAAVAGFRSKIKAVRRIVLEMTAVILLTPLLDMVSGVVIQSQLNSLLAFPGLLVIIPPFVSQAGALGGILSSRLTSKLQLGVITTRGLPEEPAWLDASLVLAFSVVIFTFIGVVGVGISDLTGLATPGAWVTIGGTLVAGLLATLIAIGTAYYVAILTARFGLDPDNHAVPIITSVLDLVGVLCLLLVMGGFGVR